MSNLMQVLAYLDRNELKYRHEEGAEFIEMYFSGDHGSYRLLVRVEEGSNVQSFAIPPMRVPAGARGDVALAVVRANYGMKLGKFEMDLDDGELRFQVAVPIEVELPGDKTMDRLIHIGIAMLDRYLPAFYSVIYGNEPAKDAIALVER